MRLLSVLVLLAAVLDSSGVQVAAEVPSPAQIEADWLRQNELRIASPAAGAAIAPEEDAAGACDGVKTGKWGFHTLAEANPWWQVDLGAVASLDRMLIYNRCDEFAPRNRAIIVLVSDDAAAWRQVYQHDGTVFYGHSDGKPLSVVLTGQQARYVRLQLPGTSYFHLDEVEVFAAGSPANIALGKPATQSSVSQWSERHTGTAARAPAYQTAEAIERGQKLAEHLKLLGADVASQAEVLGRLSGELEQLADEAADEVRRRLYFDARRTVRSMALANPLLDFNQILFVKRAPPMFPHMSDQYYGWWQRPGGGIWILDGFKTGSPQARSITEGWPDGNFLRPDLSYDGRKVLFAYSRFYPEVAMVEKASKEKVPEDCFFHLFEMNLDGTGIRQLTHGRYDDFDGRYLPNGEIVFLSTRKGQAIQTTKAGTLATCSGTMPDSYVRCGGDNFRPVPVFTLHVMDADGGEMRPMSAFENFEWQPSVAADGRVLFARWDYIDRFNGPYMSLWVTNPDGTNPQLVYGNYTERPQCAFEARAVPGSQKVVFTASAHHSNEGGSLVMLDRTKGTEGEAPLERLTPEVCFPETEGWPTHFYANPYPISEDFFLVSWSDRPLPPHSRLSIDDPRNPANAQGIYLYDRFGNLELLYRDGDISSMYPLPVRPRWRPPELPDTVAWDGPQEGRFLQQDVYRGLPGVERGTVKRLRIVAVPPKTQPHMNNPVLGVSKEDPGKFVLGTAPVEADGSAFFRVPSGVPVLFQALDAEGLAVQTMRSLTYVQPGQTLSCIGCHESREAAPATSPPPLAALREPSRLAPGPAGSWPLSFAELVQPVLDRHCTGCHAAKEADPKAAAPDLTPAKAYESLMGFADGDLEKLAFEKPRSLPGNCPASQSRLLALLRGGHEGVRLEEPELERLVTWMDTYAQRQGHFSPEQEQQLREFRRAVAAMMDE